MFKQRLERPLSSNKNYIRDDEGGWNTCIKGSPTDKQCNVLSNCVGYASGRFNEIYNELAGTTGCKFKTLNCNAENFIERAEKEGLQISDKPQPGSIIVWQGGKAGNNDDGVGHVAVVEQVYSATSILTSESNYGSSTPWNLKVRDNSNGRWGLKSTFSTRGFILNPMVKNLPWPVSENISVDQVVVSSDLQNLRVRTSSSTSAENLGYCISGYFNVLEKTIDDKYTWYRIDADRWIAQVEGVTFIPKTELELPVPVEKNDNVNQVLVSISNLRVRTGASTDASILGLCSQGYFNVLEIVKDSSYNWYKIGASAWIAGVNGVSYNGGEDDPHLFRVLIDRANYEYRWSIDGNQYGTPGDVASMNGHYDNLLKDAGWEEILAVNGGIFYPWDGDYYANGLEKSRGVNNQDVNMSAVADYNNAMAIGATYTGDLVFAKQSYIISHLDEYYGAVTGMGILLGGEECTYGRKEFSSQWNCISGRTIIGEDNNGNFLSYSLAGVTGKSGLYGKELVSLCKSLGFRNAILLDGGGSVWRRINGKDDITTTRKTKNSVHLYRKQRPNSVVEEKPVIPEAEVQKPVEENKELKDLQMKVANFELQVKELNEQLNKLVEEKDVIEKEHNNAAAELATTKASLEEALKIISEIRNLVK